MEALWQFSNSFLERNSNEYIDPDYTHSSAMLKPEQDQGKHHLQTQQTPLC